MIKQVIMDVVGKVDDVKHDIGYRNDKGFNGNHKRIEPMYWIMDIAVMGFKLKASKKAAGENHGM